MRLLLIEDDEPLARRIQHALESAGHVVVWVADGVEGDFRGREEDFDLVILDLGLPDKPGLEVLAGWRERGLRIPVLILTARDTWQERVEGRSRRLCLQALLHGGIARTGRSPDPPPL